MSLGEIKKVIGETKKCSSKLKQINLPKEKTPYAQWFFGKKGIPLFVDLATFGGIFSLKQV
jgi:hypothetical protein